MAKKELWEIVEGSKEPMLSISDPQARLAYHKKVKKAFAKNGSSTPSRL